MVDVDILDPLEFTLGILMRGPVTWREIEEVIDWAVATGDSRLGLVSKDRVEVTIRMLSQAGVIGYRDGGMVLVMDRLHPAYRAIAESAGRVLAGILGEVCRSGRG